MKPKFKYDIRKSVMDGHEYTYPAIVERAQTLTLRDVIRNAIDTGRIVGLKDTAAETIEDAILIQIYAELEAGNSVKFEDYFKIMLYMDGTTDANGTLSDENKLVPRFINGKELGITRDLFKFEYADGGDCPNVTEVKSANDNVPDWTIKGSDDIVVMGSHFLTGSPADEVAVIFAPEEGDEIRVTQIVTPSENLLRIHRPEALAEGRYRVRVERSDGDSSKVYPSNGRTVTVADDPVAPTAPTITLVKCGELPDDEVDFDEENRIVVTGTGLTLGDGDSFKLELCPDKGAATGAVTEFKNIQSSDTEISFLNDRNTSGRPDGDWWGKDVLLTVTVGGVSATRWLKFHDWND